MPLFLLTALLAFSQTAYAIDCNKAVTTPDLNDCASIEQKKIEGQLNDTYKRVIKMLEKPEPSTAEGYTATKKRLIEAQRAWIKFREIDCDALYTFYKDGTIRNLIYLGCMQTHAEQRIKELKNYDPQ
jgi:uncharacterized protein YecT (DUF1311 family)